ncbi:MAG: hypothetical protein AUK35_04630 [Zetaproteobacteria bacterium CG2_30_46_52]|nr:MAG: hypothetical protein AUK35_04630 [Zetaproteobacteria bacterium CG2_30_46_52]
MAMTIRPADALVNRLLQQQRSEPVTTKPTSSAAPVTDKVSISDAARQNLLASDKPDDKANNTYPSFGFKQQELENQLLKLYSSDKNSGT